VVIEDLEDVADMELTGDEAIIGETKHGGESVVGENIARENTIGEVNPFALFEFILVRLYSVVCREYEVGFGTRFG